MSHAELTCVDTSAWIEYLRNSKHPVVPRTQELLLVAQVCVADVVIGELFQGVRSQRERAIIEEVVETLPVISGTPQTWKEAGQLAGRARSQGKTVHLLDCYLASLVQERGVAFLTCDGHFGILRAILPQLQVQVIVGT